MVEVLESRVLVVALVLSVVEVVLALLAAAASEEERTLVAVAVAEVRTAEVEERRGGSSVLVHVRSGARRSVPFWASEAARPAAGAGVARSSEVEVVEGDGPKMEAVEGTIRAEEAAAAEVHRMEAVVGPVAAVARPK